MNAKPLTPEEEAALREPLETWPRRLKGWPIVTLRLLATLDALRASLDPERPEAVEAWAAALRVTMPSAAPEGGRWYRQIAAALLRARAEAGRP
jgi:hypothetical protein